MGPELEAKIREYVVGQHLGELSIEASNMEEIAREVLEETGGGPDRGDRVREALPGEVRRGAVHRLEERVRVAHVRRLDEPEPARVQRREVGEDVAEQVRSDDDIEPANFFYTNYTNT